MTTPHTYVDTEASQICVSIIGMAGCGKTTIGRLLAAHLQWAHLDTDLVIESTYAVKLQRLTERLPREEFLHIEDETIRSLRLRRTIISTGGSAVYSTGAMKHLRSLGPVVHLEVPLPAILERIARKPERGLVIAPGQTVEGLFDERATLYQQWRTHTLHTSGDGKAEDVARSMARLLNLVLGEAAPLTQHPTQLSTERA